MTKFVVVKINPATEKLCSNKKRDCSFLYTDEQQLGRWCPIFLEYIEKNKRCKKCVDNETDVLDDDVLTADDYCDEEIENDFKKTGDTRKHICKLVKGHKGKHMCYLWTCKFKWGKK